MSWRNIIFNSFLPRDALGL